MAAELVNGLRSSVGLGHPLEAIELVPSGGGVFEVFADDKLVFSKKQLGRHAEPGEILRLFGEMS